MPYRLFHIVFFCLTHKYPVNYILEVPILAIVRTNGIPLFSIYQRTKQIRERLLSFCFEEYYISTQEVIRA